MGGQRTGPLFMREGLGMWKHDAACTDADMDLFFPTAGESNWDAKQICKRCPVRVDCLEYALKRPHIMGIWGGASEREREVMRRVRRIR